MDWEKTQPDFLSGLRRHFNFRAEGKCRFIFTTNPGMNDMTGVGFILHYRTIFHLTFFAVLAS